MNDVLLTTLSTSFRKVRTTNTTDSSYPSRVPTATRPSGTGNAAAQTTSAVFDLGLDKQKNGIKQQNAVIIVPFGVGSDTNTFSTRVIGWRMVPGNPQSTTPTVDLWIPVPLVDLTCTLSTPAGVAGTEIGSSNLFCDTLAIANTIGVAGQDCVIKTNGANLIAQATVDMQGYQLVEVTFTTGSSATSCNALIALY